MANEPEVAAEFAAETPSIAQLPEKVKKTKYPSIKEMKK